ncbi:hypothetical protein JOF28_000715 [Leucobacter exalbidus]|uniref:DUF4365 domain-containing protein n=1 Tax=Leucobacter exalbidus TaxID=662960 RepID=A0A940PRK8_9MICO|nr:DUF4365 domain-containing protein [Leucobacter exalbidus]MBP1325483.1 hypothetical protein [Leucobacter exalbidus]
MTEARTKQRQRRHISADSGVDIVKRKLPRSWVVREMSPDYGLDLHVEVFGPDPTDPESANTLGEHFYIQVKATEQIELHKHVVRSRGNVTKLDPAPNDGTPMTIRVAKFTLDTETLLTVETMGAAIPVLLCYVDLKTEDVYYVCLNDYLAKVLLPTNPAYQEQNTATVYIPSWNQLDQHDPSFSYIGLLARRGKYYSAFNTFAYQLKELDNALFRAGIPEPNSPVVVPPRELLTLVRLFLRADLRLAIWDKIDGSYWSPLEDVQSDLKTLQDTLPKVGAAIPAIELTEYMSALHIGFSRAVNLGRMYEELVREWRQPTYLAAGLDRNPAQAVNPPEWPE